MKPYHAQGSRVIKAPPERVYAILTDYREAHPRILPKPYFMSLHVDKGGIGEGTQIQFQMNVLGKTQNFRAAITEPEPGREIDEVYSEPEGVITRFFVHPFGHDKQSKVTIQTEGRIESHGLFGWLERLFATTYLHHVFRKELELLAASAEEDSPLSHSSS
jgi:Polyketide cyclase / dehydrase and lipid transport